MTRRTLVTVALLFVVDSQGASQSNACTTIAPTAPISEIGAFSNMRDTAEHAYGETVLLWRSGNCIVGLFESAQGLAGDTPIGELQNVTHNRSTGELRFSAKLTIGIVAGGALTAPQTSRDLFTFDGTLGATRLIGGLIHANQVDPKPPLRTVMLTASARDAESMRGSATLGAWRGKWQPILKRRGPKW
jgi:hypothetical protein